MKLKIFFRNAISVFFAFSFFKLALKRVQIDQMRLKISIQNEIRARNIINIQVVLF